MRFSSKAAFFVPAITLGLAAGSALAQTNTTELSGTVTDASGAKLPGANVTITNTANGEVKAMPTKSAGEYIFPQLMPGHYKVVVEHDGFSQKEAELDILVATPSTLNFKLDVGSSQVVTVEAPIVSSTLNQSDATLGKAFDNTQIQTLPYLANNTLSLLSLQPGVTQLDPGATTDTRAGTINGARQDQTNLTLDGTDNNNTNYGYAFTGILRATRDSIEEFRVTTTGANADAGRSSGAQVSLQTKSGTNHVHGSAYYYYRDPAMASNNWFYKQSELATVVNGVYSPKPNIASKILQNTYGGSLGLPLIKNKLFFFGAYEGFKQATNAVVTATVPLGTGLPTDYGVKPGLRNGTLSYLNTGTTNSYTTLTPAQIAAMDPKCAAQGGCPAGPGVNTAAVNYFNTFFPTSNASGGDGINTGAYTFTSPAPLSQVTNIARLDYNISPKMSVFVRGNLQSDNTLNAQIVPGSGAGSQVYGNSRGLTGGWIWNLSNNAVNNFRYGYTRSDDATRGASANYVSFAALTTPYPTTFSTVYLQNLHNFIDDFTLIKGRHTIQFGGNDRLVYNNRFLTKFLYETANVTSADLAVGGILNQNTDLDVNFFATALNVPKAASSFKSSYNSAVTAVTGIESVGSAYANYSVSPNGLTALPAGTLPTHTFRSFEQEYYVQDQWKVSQKLVVTAGLRYAYLGVPFEANGQQVRPLTSTRTFLANRIAAMNAGTNYDPYIYTGAGGPVNNAPGFWQGDKKDFAPRLSFAYSPDAKTSVRGGFMLAYDHFGQGAVNSYNDSYSFGLSSSLSRGVIGTVDNDPRFTGAHVVSPALLNTAAPGGLFPILNAGGSGYITQAFDDQLHTPYSETFNLTVQREMFKGFTGTATYSGRLGHHLLALNDVAMPLNLKDPSSGRDYFTAMQQLDKYYDAGTATSAVPSDPYWTNLFPTLACTVGNVKLNPTQSVYSQLARSNETATLQEIDVPGAGLPSTCTNSSTPNRYYDPQYSSLYNESTIGNSNYNALQLSVRHIINRHFIYDFNYTFSKSMDMGSSPERSGGNVIYNTFNPSQMYAVSDFDVRHNITADWVADLPYGHGQRFGGRAPRLLDEVFGGWQLTGVLRYGSAFPWSAYANTSGWATDWDYQSYSVQLNKVNTPGHHGYTPGHPSTMASVFTTPSAFGSSSTEANTNSQNVGANFRAAYAGESGQRNELRADGYFSMDPGLSKSFHTFREQSFKLIIEYFNVTNAVRFGTPASGSTITSFGQYTSILNSPRQAQFAGRYYF